MNVGNALACEHANLDGADDFLGVARSNAAGGFAVEAGEQAMEVFGAMLGSLLAEALAEFL